MAGFSKLFGTMWGGSLYGRFEASAVFMVLLSLCDHNGVVDMTPEAIAGTTGWPIDFIHKGLSELVAPDHRSRTPDASGRRLINLDDHRDWGWRITNYAKYRDEMRSIERREYLAEAKRRERAKDKESTLVNKSTIVNPNQPITEAEAEAEADTDKTTLSGKPDVRSSSGENNKLKSDAKEVLEFLNETTGRKYRPVEATINPIICRLRSGVTVEDCRTLIIRKWRDWHKDEKMEKYLRPATLFRATNFENYLAECVGQ